MIIKEIKKNLLKAASEIGVSKKFKTFNVEKSKTFKQGDFSTNIAMALAKELKKSPMKIAEELVSKIDKKSFDKVEILKPGFINFYLSTATNSKLIHEILKEKTKFGYFPKTKLKYNVEYVSANPTGYLHIGHARNAVLGDTIAKLLEISGNTVIREYVVNDAGNQMNKLASSVLVRYKQALGQKIELPEDSYHGEEIKIVAKNLEKKYGKKFEKTKFDKDFNIEDKKINYIIRWFARDALLEIIKDNLKSLGTIQDIYYSEQEMHDSGAIPKVIKRLGENAYKKDGAVWLKSTKFGDDKDRVIIKSDGNPTYFAPDIAYHELKLNRGDGVDYLINIWGADHYSYITRMKNALQALGYNADILTVVCMQMVKLVKDGKEFKLSKRSGNSLRLIDLVDTIGKDAARWFLISQSANTHIELDVDIATKKDNNNPIFYVQYAHARANQVLSKADYKEPKNFDLLTSEQEKELLDLLHYYKHTIEIATTKMEPHKITLYLTTLAKYFHSFYSSSKIIDPEHKELSAQRYFLVKACKQVLVNGLDILGISAPTKM